MNEWVHKPVGINLFSLVTPHAPSIGAAVLLRDRSDLGLVADKGKAVTMPCTLLHLALYITHLPGIMSRQSEQTAKMLGGP